MFAFVVVVVVYCSLVAVVAVVVAVYLSVCLSICLSVYLSISIYLSLSISIYLSISLYLSLSLYLSIYLSNLSNYLFSYLQVSKRSCSARLPQFLNLTTSEVQQLCETSSICELDNVKIEAILRDFFNFSKLTTSKTKQFCETSFKNGKLRAELTASCQCAFRFFHSICLKYCLPGKSEAGSYEVLHLSRKIIFPKLKILCFKMQPLSTSLMNTALVLPLPREIHLCRSSSNVPHLPSFWICYKTLTFCSLLARCRSPCACHTKRRFNVQKWREHVVFLAF